MDKNVFYKDVYAIVAQIPFGTVLTYGWIAKLAGYPQYSRMVGQAMHNAPINLPCHRVVNSKGQTAPTWLEQRYLLEQEGIYFTKAGKIDLTVFLWNICKID